MKTWYGFWLLFESKTNKTLLQTIKQLSKISKDAPMFVPHTSVYRSTETDFETASEAIAKVSLNVDPFDIEVKGVNYNNDDWSKTLYLELETHPTHLRLSQSLSEVFEKPYNLSPHISLSYSSKITPEIKEEFIKNYSPPKQVTVNSIAIINPHSEENSWKNYGKWTIEYQHEFS